MFSLRKSVNNVKGIKLYSCIEIIGYINRELFVNSEKIASEVDTTSGSLKIFSTFLFFDVKDTNWIYDLENRKSYNLEGHRPYTTSIQDGNLICTYEIRFINNKFSWKTGLYNFIEQKLIRKYDFLNNVSILYYLNRNKVITSAKGSLSLVCLTTHEYEWEVDLGSYGEVRKIIGLEDNKLWVSMYRAGANRDEKQLLAIDIKTGKIDFQLDKSLPISDWFLEKIEEKHTLLSIYGKISTAPADSLLVEIDAKTGAVIRNERIESLYKENLKIGFWRVLDDKIYFTANKDMLNGTHIGVLDYHSLELLWFTKVKDSKAGFRDFQVSEDKIYVLDQGNQLHIFEATKIPQ